MQNTCWPTFYDSEAAAAIDDGMWFDHHIAGISWDDDDGHSRQDAARILSPGQEVVLVREPDNKHDKTAIAVRNGGIRLGYISAKPEDFWNVDGGMARWLTPRLVAGERWRAFVRALVGGRSQWGKETLGVRLVFVMLAGEGFRVSSHHPLGDLVDEDGERPFKGEARALYGDLVGLWSVLPPEHQASLASIGPGIMKFGGAPDDVRDYLRQLRNWARTQYARPSDL